MSETAVEHGPSTPVVLIPRTAPIEAMRWTGDNWDAVCAWVYGKVIPIPEDWADAGDEWPVVVDSGRTMLNVLEGDSDGEAIAEPGEWLLKTPDGWYVGDDATLGDHYIFPDDSHAGVGQEGVALKAERGTT